MDDAAPPTVVSLRAVARGRKRLIALSDGRELLVTAEALARVSGLDIDEPVDDATIRALGVEDVRATVHEAALRLLSSRARSEKEIATRLAGRGFPADAVEAEVVRLRGSGLLDDAAFAASWVETRRRVAPRGQRLLRHELRSKGIGAESVELATADIDDAEAALALARVRAPRAPRDSFERFQAKIGGFLLRRGFGHGPAMAAVRTVWAEVQQEDTEG